MIKLDNLDRWHHLAKGSTLTLPGTNARRIRINVNSPGRSCLYIVTSDGELQFLAAPVGRSVVEFAAPGDVTITTDDEDVFVYSAETEPTFAIIENAEVFTKIHERAPRNHDAEMIAYRVEAAALRRMAQMEAGFKERIAKYDAERATIVKSDAPGTVAQPAGEERGEPDSVSKPSGKDAGKADTKAKAAPSGD